MNCSFALELNSFEGEWIRPIGGGWQLIVVRSAATLYVDCATVVTSTICQPFKSRFCVCEHVPPQSSKFMKIFSENIVQKTASSHRVSHRWNEIRTATDHHTGSECATTLNKNVWSNAAKTKRFLFFSFLVVCLVDFVLHFMMRAPLHASPVIALRWQRFTIFGPAFKNAVSLADWYEERE